VPWKNAALTTRCAIPALAIPDKPPNLAPIKAAFPAYQEMHSQVLQDVLRRVDKTFAAFFRRVATGETPGYPRFKSTHRYKSFTYPQSGFALAGWQGPGKERYALLTLSKMGDLKVRLHRPMQGQVKTCTIRRDGDQWYVTFSCEVDEEPLPPSDEAVGID
jgi:putative transposase